jgi:hypothetical protein
MLKIHAQPPIDQEAWQRVKQLADLLGDKIEVSIFPDATDENWGIPTGILMRARTEEALLFPAMLRDPGCGFLVFRLVCENYEGIQKDLYNTLSTWADTFQDHEAGLKAISQINLPLTKEERDLIVEGFGSLINTLEIRSVYGSTVREIKDGDLLGFLHGGCEGFIGVLEKRFGLAAAQYSLEHALFPHQAIGQGFFAFPYASSEGQEYVLWLQEGMELSRRSRLCAFEALFDEIRKVDAKLSLQFSWDAVHSGLEINSGEVLTFRGVQRVDRMALVAGHRETSACIVVPGIWGPSGMISHGIAFIEEGQEENPFDLPALQRAVKAICNTPKNYHIVATLENALRQYIQKASTEGLLEPAAWLAPQINIQGKKRKAGAMKSLPPRMVRETCLGDYRIEVHQPFKIQGEAQTAVIILDRNLPEVTDDLCNQLIERAISDRQVTPFDLYVIESGSDGNLLSRYTTHHFVDDTSTKIGLRIARGLNAGIMLLPGYEYYGFFTNDVVLTHAADTIGTAQSIFTRYPKIGLIECLGTSDGFEMWLPHSHQARPIDPKDHPLFYTPYPIIRAVFLRGDLVRRLSPEVLCSENWRNWGNDEDLGYRTWQAGYFVAASSQLSIHEETFLSTKKHARVRTEDEFTFKNEAQAQMEAFISSRYQTDIMTFRKRVFQAMLANMDDQLPVICPGNLIRLCTT